MHRLTCLIAATFVVSGFGCSVDPPPMVVLMPTYAFDRDEAEVDVGLQARPRQAIAAVEP